jgi:hypothetical protein
MQIRCVDKRGKPAHPRKCPDLDLFEHVVSKPCSVHDCPSFWRVSPFGECTSACGLGQTTRQVECRSSHASGQLLLDATLCPFPEPASTVPCNQKACASWVSGPWSQCWPSHPSQSCGTGIRNRTVSCMFDGLKMSFEECADTDSPFDTEPCKLHACPQWEVSAYSNCSRSCVQVFPSNLTIATPLGHQTRVTECRAFDGNVLDGSKCVDQPAPELRRECLESFICPTYHYEYASWSKCDADGFRYPRSITCVAFVANREIEVDQALCSDLPVTSEKCPSVPPPTFERVPASWTPSAGMPSQQPQCIFNASCSFVSTQDPLASISGVDEQKCIRSDRIPLMVVSPSLCGIQPTSDDDTRDADATDATNATNSGNATIDYAPLCPGAPLTHCKQQAACMPMYAHSGSSYVCDCPPGFHGDFCEFTSAVSRLDLDVGFYDPVQGVAVHDPIRSKLAVDGNIPHVRLVMNTDEWMFPAYIESDLISIMQSPMDLAFMLDERLYLSTVHDMQNQSLGISVTAWFGPNADHSATSNSSFNVADPCGYKSCGTSGTCVRGKCECLPGYFGASCEQHVCDESDCNAEHGYCEFSAATVIDTDMPPSVCVCDAGFTAESNCHTPATCSEYSANCANNGRAIAATTPTSDVDYHETDVSCACECKGAWMPETNCTTCGLVCENNSTANADCSACDCPAYFTGPLCACQFALLELTIRTRSAAELQVLLQPVSAADQSEHRRFAELLVYDVAFGLSVKVDRVEFVETRQPLKPRTGSVVAVVRVFDQSTCFPDTSAAPAIAQMVVTNTSDAIALPTATQVPTLELLEYAQVLNASASTPHSELRRGVVTSRISAVEITLPVAAVPVAFSQSNPRDLYLAVSCSIAAVLIALGILYMLRRKTKFLQLTIDIPINDQSIHSRGSIASPVSPKFPGGDKKTSSRISVGSPMHMSAVALRSPSSLRGLPDLRSPRQKVCVRLPVSICACAPLMHLYI